METACIVITLISSLCVKIPLVEWAQGVTPSDDQVVVTPFVEHMSGRALGGARVVVNFFLCPRNARRVIKPRGTPRFDPADLCG